MKIIECVPNFSEGRNMLLIKSITDAMESISGITLLDVDPGADTNRTVVTIVGNPESVINAAFMGIKKATELIHMKNHKGAHPIMGATDVCPLIPISNVNINECKKHSITLAKKVSKNLNIPIYLYESSATHKERINLSNKGGKDCDILYYKLIIFCIRKSDLNYYTCDKLF